MRTAGQALTRPELAVLMAYSKLELFDDIVASTAPDDEFFRQTLVRYFPTPLARYEADMQRHRLRREIISTVLANEIINMCGPTFPERLRISARCDTGAMVLAFEAARQVFRLDQAWDQVSALDLKISAEAQTALYQEIATALRRQTSWLARRAMQPGATVSALVAAYRPAADALRASGSSVLSPVQQEQLERQTQRFIALGVPEAMARDFAMMRPMGATADVCDLSRPANWPEPATARLYHQVGARFGLDRLRAGADSVRSADHFDRLAVRRLIDDLMAEQFILTRSLLTTSEASAGASEASAKAAVDAWIGSRQALVEAVHGSIDQLEASGSSWTFSKLALAFGELRAAGWSDEGSYARPAA